MSWIGHFTTFSNLSTLPRTLFPLLLGMSDPPAASAHACACAAKSIEKMIGIPSFHSIHPDDALVAHPIIIAAPSDPPGSRRPQLNSQMRPAHGKSRNPLRSEERRVGTEGVRPGRYLR